MTPNEIETKLQALESDPAAQTKGTYSPTATEYPDNILPFTQFHLAYLRKNKRINPEHYLSNLEIMTKR